MDSNLANSPFQRRSAIKLSTIIVSIVNTIISIWLSFAVNSYIEGPATIMEMILNILFCLFNLNLLYAMYIGKTGRILLCLEVFIVLFILNIIPMTSREPFSPCIDISFNFVGNDFRSYEQKYNTIQEFIWKYEKKKFKYDQVVIISNIFYVIVVAEIFLVYQYYNYELKFSKHNISLAPLLRENPSAPVEQMALSCNTTQQPEQCISLQPGLHLIQHPGQNISQQPNQYIITHEPGQLVIQQPGTSAFNAPHVIQGPFLPGLPIVQQ